MRQISMVAEITDIKGVGPSKAETLAENGYESVEDIAQAEPDELAEVNGVGDDRALEYIVGAEDVLEAQEEVEEDYPEDEGDEFDLTPSEVGEELKDDSEAAESDVSASDDEDDPSDAEEDEPAEDEAEPAPAPVESEDPTYELTVSFASRQEYDSFHAALMRHHENVYTSNQPASDVMERVLDELHGNVESVSFELTEFELNTLHTSVKRTRTDYQGNNLIDHMEALQAVEEQIDEARHEKLF